MIKTFFNVMPAIVALAILLILGAYFGLPAQMPETPREVVYNEEVAEALSNEYALIDKMPGAVESGYSFAKDSEKVSIGAKYTTEASYEEIREFYDIVLKEHDWQFIGEEKITDWGRDLGEKSLRYQKGDFLAIIEYAGDRVKPKRVYGFSMAWGDVYNRVYGKQP